MNTVFLAWIETAARSVGWASASGAVLILGVLVMRKVLGGRLGLGWRSVLGWLVVVRLVCLAAPESRWSWRNWVGAGHSSLVTAASAVRIEGSLDTLGQARGDSASGRSSIHQPASHKAREDSASSLSSPHQPPTQERVEARLEPEQSGDGRRQPPSARGWWVEDRLEPERSGDGRRQPLSSLAGPALDRLEAPSSLPGSVSSRVRPVVAPGLALVWLVGAVGFFGLAVARHFVFWHRVRWFSRPLPAGSDGERWLEECRGLLRVRRRVRLRTLDGLGSPVVFGFFRPRILLPAEVAGSLTAREARHIFLHELAHIRCGDVLANWLLIATRALHWFNPLVWVALRQFVADRELVRDAMALRVLPGGDAARREYGHTLLRLATTVSRPRLSPGLASLIHTEKEIQRRIAMIKTPLESNRPLWPQALAGALGLALVAVTFTAAASGQAPTEAVTEIRNPDPSPVSPIPPAGDPAAAATVDPTDPAPSELTVPVEAGETDRDTKQGSSSVPPGIRKRLERGLGYIDLGVLDKARDEFNGVLALDRFNTDARRQLERIERLISDDHRAASAEEAEAKALIDEVATAEKSTINRLQINEQRLAQLDSEVAKMTAEGRKQEMEILTSLRGELLKEIYRARYLPSVEPSASLGGRYERGATASLSLDKPMTARVRVEAEPGARTGAAMKIDPARLAHDPSAEVSALRQQVAAMARQIEELSGQLAQRANWIHENSIRDRETRLKHIKDLGAGPIHPEVVALKEAIEAEKRQIDESAKSIRKEFRSKLKEPRYKKADASAKPESASPNVPPSADDALPEPKAEPKPEPKPVEPAR